MTPNDIFRLRQAAKLQESGIEAPEKKVARREKSHRYALPGCATAHPSLSPQLRGHLLTNRSILSLSLISGGFSHVLRGEGGTYIVEPSWPTVQISLQEFQSRLKCNRASPQFCEKGRNHFGGFTIFGKRSHSLRGGCATSRMICKTVTYTSSPF